MTEEQEGSKPCAIGIGRGDGPIAYLSLGEEGLATLRRRPGKEEFHGSLAESSNDLRDQHMGMAP
jgi:hypothetical protein